MPDDGADSAGTLRVEAFLCDLDAFVDFYTEVLGFTLAAHQRDSESP